MLILPPVGLIMYVFAKPLTAFFVPGEDYGIHHGAMFIKIMAPNFGLLGVQQVMIGVFNGAGFTTASADLYSGTLGHPVSSGLCTFS